MVSQWGEAVLLALRYYRGRQQSDWRIGELMAHIRDSRKSEPTLLDGLAVIEPRVFRDERGYFFERFNHRQFADRTGLVTEFVQDNQSRSSRGVIRGLHYQIAPSAQGKLVSCTRGEVFDVAVDIRRSSSTFAQWFGIFLSEENNTQLWIPPGFAHGFLAMTDVADVQYKATAYYDPETERAIRWNDPTVGIDWPAGSRLPILAEKDAAAPLLGEADVFT